MNTKPINEAALAYHKELPAGKLGIYATKPVQTNVNMGWNWGEMILLLLNLCKLM